jgi:hypothetical protein
MEAVPQCQPGATSEGKESLCVILPPLETFKEIACLVFIFFSEKSIRNALWAFLVRSYVTCHDQLPTQQPYFALSFTLKLFRNS